MDELARELLRLIDETAFAVRHDQAKDALGGLTEMQRLLDEYLAAHKKGER